MKLPDLKGINNPKKSEKVKELPKIEEIPEIKVKKEPSKSALYDWGEPFDDKIIRNTYADNGWVGTFNIDKVLSEAIEEKASDVHINADLPVSFTINGDLYHEPKFVIPNGEVMDTLVHAILTHQEYGEYAHKRDYDFAYIMKFGPYKGRRFRGNVGRSFGQDFLEFRVISETIPTMDELNVEPEIREWAELPNGLWMICGPTGTGKSTTLASIIHHTQLTERKKVITIEKPVEYTYPREGKALIVQREVGIDTNSFANGLTAAMRENPDIILIGEVRNNEEVSQLLAAAESGHLAISTMHTNAIATTINRIQSLFEGGERGRILSTLSDTLRGLANQVLLKDIHGNRFACREILTFNAETRKLVANGDVAGIRDYQRKHHITMEDNLVKLVKSGKCTKTEARNKAAFPEAFDRIMKENSFK